MMKSPDHQFHATNAAGKTRVHGGVRKRLLVALVCSIFLITGHAGLTTVAEASQVSIQILVEIGRLSFAALQIFGS